MFDINKILYQHFNERDVEVPALMDALVQAAPVRSFLDVGAHYSWYAYALVVRGLLNTVRNGAGPATYTAVDILDCERTREIVDAYHVGNVRDLPLEPHDFVACISTIEHSGISTYKQSNWRQERHFVFERLVELAGRHLFVTFPFGQFGVHEGQYANITADDLDEFELTAEVYGLHRQEHRFFYTEFAQGQKPWREITRAEAVAVPMDKQLGTQCVCTFHASRE